MRGGASHYPELDGLRGLAILLVVTNHYRFQDLVGGLDLFFVLSGFLLGGILMEKKGTENYLKTFYMRRACRLLPLYFVVILSFFAAGALFGGKFFSSVVPLWSYLTFTQNFSMALAKDWNGNVLAPLWSLAVEEQFCLLLPLLIAFVSPKMLPRALLLAILAAPILRVAVLGTVGKAAEVPAYVLLPMRADSLLLGVLCAWAVRHYRHLLEERIKVLYGALAVFLVMLFLANSVFHVEGLENTVVALLWSCLLLVAVTKGVMPLRLMPLRMLAPLAYAAFMLHLPIEELCEVLGWGKLAAFALTFALAAVSWHLFEKRFVAWGKRFRYKRAISSSTPTPDPARA